MLLFYIRYVFFSLWYTAGMYIKVQLLNGFSEHLWYQQPDDWPRTNLAGAIVRVPLRNQQLPALVINQQGRKPDVPFEIRLATTIEPLPQDATYQRFIGQLSAYCQINPIHLIKRIKQFLYQKETKALIEAEKKMEPSPVITLTHAQQEIVEALKPLVIDSHYQASLIHGVTGSGKTEIYKELIKTAIAQKKCALLLLPEVTLALEFERRLNTELSDIQIYSFHSATPPKQKRLLWQQLLAHKPLLIIGVHLPVLLPIGNLGLIIVDEEHEVGYQEKKHPKINSKEAALLRAKILDIPIILGSATPSISTLYNVKQKKWRFFQLKDRFAGAFPEIKTVLLTDKKKRKQFWISKKLHDAIKDRLAKKEQTIIFLNRRGHSFFVQCKGCSHIFECPSCSVSLTLHTNNVMNCHYCEFATQEPKKCPSCNGTTFLRKGIGTQQAVTILQSLFPNAHIARADLDTTKKKKEWHQTVIAMQKGEIDILVGTQTITKGFHFPRVTLVGILWADLNLHFPIFNAAETTLQQLIQVAGRAGRQTNESTVIVQAMDNYPIFKYLNEVDYLSYYKEEIIKRAMLGYPPNKRLVEIELKNTNEAAIEKESHDITALMHAIQRKNNLSIQILGPAKPPVHKIKNWYSRKIYLKAHRLHEIISLYQQAKRLSITSYLFFTPHPTR